MQIFADDLESFCLYFLHFFTSRYNSNVLSQFGISQYNSLTVQS